MVHVVRPYPQPVLARIGVTQAARDFAYPTVDRNELRIPAIVIAQSARS
jgi:hypothetical protein